jgi:hypothetical protein
MKVRRTLTTPQEEENLDGYLEIGLFRWARQRSERIALFALCFDIQHALDLLQLRRQCESYEVSQPLFRAAPNLLDHIRMRAGGSTDRELIDVTAIESVGGSSIYKVAGGFARLIPHLNPGIVNWAQSTYPRSPIFVRLDPFYFQRHEPGQLLTEATLVPANPKWLADFSLRKGMGDFAMYELQDVSARDDARQYWDFRIRGIRRLEVRVERRDNDYLTMMMEELPRPDEANDLMVGRCIHLDTRDPVGTPLKSVKLNHLDLAINVYQGQRRFERFEQTMQTGKVVDASFRTHVFRIEQANFLSLFDFSRQFLRSMVLLGEWIQEVMIG